MPFPKFSVFLDNVVGIEDSLEGPPLTTSQR
jgi:hypothetical protein